MTKIDQKGKPCPCGRGTYQETTVYDDWDGVLHCTACNAKVHRWVGEK